MVTCYIKRMTASCLPTIGHLCDTISIAVRKVLETVANLLKDIIYLDDQETDR